MKKLLILFVAAALSLTASAAMAAVQGTPHQYGATYSTYGQCQVCHVPHAAKTGKRLWRESVTINISLHTWSASTVGALCGTCHDGGALKSAPNENNHIPTVQTTKAYATSSHKRQVARLTGTAATDVKDAWKTGQSKPYTTGTQPETGYIECTSCHNPHDDTLRPFLRPGSVAGSVSSFCADCHNRYSTTVGSANRNLWNNMTTSMHPVAVNYASVGTPTVALKVIGAGSALNNRLANASTITTWILGGKGEKFASDLQAGNNIGCGTCHAVHSPATGTDQGLHLLAMDNHGDSGMASLCQECHGGPNAGTLDNAGGNVVAGANDHPINTLFTRSGPYTPRWNTADVNHQPIRYERTADSDKKWPGAKQAGAWQTGNQGSSMCTSCHSAHAGIKGAKLRRTGSPESDWCLACHENAAPAGHHSYKGNYAKSAIGCTSCHSGFVAGTIFDAHNGFATNFDFTDAQNRLSNLCTGCHNGAANNDPVLGAAAYAGFSSIPNGYLGLGDGTHQQTHFVDALNTFFANGSSINVKRGSWQSGGNSFSKYGGANMHQKTTDATGGYLICESCHSVRWNFAVFAYSTSAVMGYRTNLLLQNYIDDGSPVVGGANSSNGGAAVGVGLCIACHNQSNVGSANAPVDGTLVNGTVNGNNVNAPRGVHPMTDWSISKAADAGRSVTTLLTVVASGSYANNAGRTVRYPAANTMDCDTCHRPHVADSKGTWTPAYKTGSVSVILEVAGPNAGEYTSLCTDCHAY